jgi:hypothetical protein
MKFYAQILNPDPKILSIRFNDKPSHDKENNPFQNCRGKKREDLAVFLTAHGVTETATENNNYNHETQSLGKIIF